MSHNQSNHYMCQPGYTVCLCCTSGLATTPAAATQPIFFSLAPAFLSLLGRTILFSRLFRILPSSLITIASPPCFLLPLPLRPYRLLRQHWKIYAAILWLSEKPHRLQELVLPSGMLPPWRKAWARACCQKILGKRVVSLFF